MNNRLRTIRNNVPRENKYDDAYWPWKKRLCPCCKAKLWYRDWSIEYRGVVESIYKCDGCGYSEHDAYGMMLIQVGTYVFEFSYSTPEKEVLHVWKEVGEAVKQWRKHRKHEINLSYRKKRSQNKRGK